MASAMTEQRDVRSTSTTGQRAAAPPPLPYANRHIPKFQALVAEGSASLSKVNGTCSTLLQVLDDGRQLTAENLRLGKHLSLSKPILVQDTPSSIGMTIHIRGIQKCRASSRSSSNSNRSSSLVQVRDIANIIGHDYPVHVIDVQHQEELEGWTMGDLVEYFEETAAVDDDNDKAPREKTTRTTNSNDATASQDQEAENVNETSNAAAGEGDASTKTFTSSTTCRRQRRAAATLAMQRQQEQRRPKAILNQISLEFSHTPLRDMVSSPQFVRDLDWANVAWPLERRRRNLDQDYPRVQYYCLTSKAGAYTDFHVDFGGTAVWYHVLRGEKHFCLIKPTEDNLTVYENWLCRPDQAEVFLVDLMLEHSRTQDVLTVTLQASQTLVIPTGWIHAVYTPRDSIVFGGNFLHGLDIPLQLQIHYLETRTRVLDRFRFPHFVPLQFYAAGMYLSKLMQPSSSSSSGTASPLCPREMEGIQDLVGALEGWWNEQGDEAMVAAARYAAQSNDCETVEEMLMLLKMKVAQRLLQQSSSHVSSEKPKLRFKMSSSSDATRPSDGSRAERAVRLKLSSPPAATDETLRSDSFSQQKKSASTGIRLKLSSPQRTKTKGDNTTTDAVPSEFRIMLDESKSHVTALPKRRRPVKREFVDGEYIATTGDDDGEWEPELPQKKIRSQSSGASRGTGTRSTGIDPKRTSASTSRRSCSSSTSRQRLMKRLR